MSLMFSASCYSVVPGAVHGFMHGPRLCLTEVHGRVALRLAATPVAQPVAQPAPNEFRRTALALGGSSPTSAGTTGDPGRD